MRNQQTFAEEISRLNPAQRRAVEQTEGPVMVIAGPGTGKTQIIAARIGNILKSDVQAGPHNILCLTYTDAGTVAMRSRLLQFIGPTAYRVNIYTFHAFCNEIIQHNLDYFGKRELEPISELENVQLLRELLDALPPDNPLKRLKGDMYYDIPRLNELFRTMKEESWTPALVSEKIDAYLADLPNRDEFIYKKPNAKLGIKAGDPKQKDIDARKEKMETLRSAAALFPKYCEMMKARGRYDYSDMILWVLDAFRRDENFLRNYQEWYQYFLVDEFQDTSGAQNAILQLLIGYWSKPNVFVVGDDDQCIYEFQGARIKNMTAFFEKYEQDLEVIVLKENYRSTQPLLDASKSVIDNNTQRLVRQEPLLEKIPALNKTLVAAGSRTDGPPPALTEYFNTLHEEAAVVDAIEALARHTPRLNEIAVIYSRHRQAENIITLLEKKKIPYTVKKKVNILDLKITEQVLNILSYLDEEARKPHSGEWLLFGIMHYDFFRISARDAAKISAHCGRERLRWRSFLADYDGLKALDLESYQSVIFLEENLTQWIASVPNLTVQLLFEKVLNYSGIVRLIAGSPEKVWLLQVVTTLFDFIKAECGKRPLLSLKELLAMIDQMRESGIALSVNKTVYEENGVNLVTAHSAKGLEFTHVFMIGCTTDMWERSRGNLNRFSMPDTLTFAAQDDENKVESARRLFYVAMTRARENLQISFAARTNEGKLLEHSQFVEEIVERTGAQIAKKHLSDEEVTAYAALALTHVPPAASATLDKQYVQSLLENYSLSVTHLNKYLDCPVAFYYENILRVPAARNANTAFGTAVHSSLKWLFEEMAGHKSFHPKKELVAVFKKELQKQRDSFTQAEYENRMALGEKILPEYYDKYVQTWNKAVVTEYNIKNIEADGVPLNGKLDKIEFDASQVNVVDYKTGSPEKGLKKLNPPSEAEPLGGDYWRQIVFYKILLDNYKRQDWKMVSGEIDFVEKHEREKDFVKKKLVVSRDDVQVVKEQIKLVYTRIMDHDFSQGCNKEDCGWCNFTKSNSLMFSQKKETELFE